MAERQLQVPGGPLVHEDTNLRSYQIPGGLLINEVSTTSSGGGAVVVVHTPRMLLLGVS